MGGVGGVFALDSGGVKVKVAEFVWRGRHR